MPSNWSDVEKTTAGGLPTMPTQAIIIGTVLGIGIISQIAWQVFLHIAVGTALIPNTGISLPFFSYGGTALMIQLLEMGIVLSVSRQIPAPKQG